MQHRCIWGPRLEEVGNPKCKILRLMVGNLHMQIRQNYLIYKKILIQIFAQNTVLFPAFGWFSREVENPAHFWLGLGLTP